VCRGGGITAGGKWEKHTGDYDRPTVRQRFPFSISHTLELEQQQQQVGMFSHILHFKTLKAIRVLSLITYF
jgi:hypothetical protein